MEAHCDCDEEEVKVMNLFLVLHWVRAGLLHNDINMHRSQYLVAKKLWAETATMPVVKT
jgi:hypothetical protein